MIREIEADETALAYEAMLALRTHLADEQEFVERVNDVPETDDQVDAQAPRTSM